jgi:diguanylate cyclase (GGDEF)-like protein/putative nucleotidyltransferase with HDIG domain
MASSPQPPAPSKLVAGAAVIGMSLAVLVLGTLAVWTAIVAQNGARTLSEAGIQTSGHLRAIQSLSLIDTSTDALEERIIPSELAKVRSAQVVLDNSLGRMETGAASKTSEIAKEGKPIVRRLKPAINRFLARPPGYDSNGTSGPEKKMEDIMEQLQVLLNNLDADPSKVFTTQLASVTASEATVRRVTLVVVPLGLASVAVCGWLLVLYRRRTEATMRTAVDSTAREARTDQLTGLPNRRALLEELERRSALNQSFTLTLADLNGFKRYNDTFGHPAGDALLKRLGHKLAAACEGHGVAARLGGDEFCVLLREIPVDESRALVTDALSEEGEGFQITAASGAVAVPEEIRDPADALRFADSRMYAAKVSNHPSSEQAMSDALMRMLNEHSPGLGKHVNHVARLALDCAETLGLPPEDVELVKRAAELHDLGKVAIPSAILRKDGPMTKDEWEFMRHHSEIGERILGGVPSLERVASTVRSSHERWDGHGYPDGLAGEEIPIGARITFVADAFCAMTEERPYALARSVASARQELRDCSGTQFDPAVVTAFLSALDRHGDRPATDDPASPVLALS